ncbi:magnesium transporter [Arenibaculum pallidiluteum]|uniref:magnesium transporter n=1 Tax=Arenibaculum pallidiluteum TaxID=2812559 RepID=UPI001F1D3C15|nr:magnesium transporter [Arenibaculum pallidiluteum]
MSPTGDPATPEDRPGNRPPEDGGRTPEAAPGDGPGGQAPGPEDPTVPASGEHGLLDAPPPRLLRESDEAEPDYEELPELVEQVREWLDEQDLARVEALVEEMHAADLADLMEQLGVEHRRALVGVMRPRIDPEVFAYLEPSIREEVVEQLEPRELAAAVAELESDDAVDLIGDLDDEARRAVLENLPAEARAQVEEGLTYPEYSAGRLMQRDLVAVPQFWTVGKVLDYLRAAGDDLPEDFFDIFIVDPLHRLIGSVPLSRVMRSKRSVKVEDIATEDIYKVPVAMDQEEVAFLFRQYALVSAPVVDAKGRLLGVIMVDDVVDVIDEEAEDDLFKLAGVGETDLNRPVPKTARARFPWLSVNVLTAFVASTVIGIFEGTIEKIVALAVLMPIVASMGGNAGMQTLTVVVRGLATRELSEANSLRVLGREAAVGVINGVFFALVVGGIAAAWFREPMLGVVIGAAMIVNLFFAAIAGALIPLGLARIGVDPAVASSVFLTTVTDVVGFMAFLGLATVILL